MTNAIEMETLTLRHTHCYAIGMNDVERVLFRRFSDRRMFVSIWYVGGAIRRIACGRDTRAAYRLASQIARSAGVVFDVRATSRRAVDIDE